MKGKYDKLLIFIVAVIILVMFATQYLTGSRGSYVLISQDSNMIGQYSLYKNTVFTVSSQDGHFNTIRIQDGQIRIEDADCPDRLCMKQGSISHNGESIICLPHKLVIQVVSDVSNNTDAVAQ